MCVQAFGIWKPPPRCPTESGAGLARPLELRCALAAASQEIIHLSRAQIGGSGVILLKRSCHDRLYTLTLFLSFFFTSFQTMSRMQYVVSCCLFLFIYCFVSLACFPLSCFSLSLQLSMVPVFLESCIRNIIFVSLSSLQLSMIFLVFVLPLMGSPLYCLC